MDNMYVFVSSLCCAIFILGAFFGYVSSNGYFDTKDTVTETKRPEFKSLYMDGKLRMRIHAMIDTEEKRKKLLIYEEVHIMPYFMIPPVSSTISNLVDVNLTAPFICLMGIHSLRMYFLPLYLVFPDLRPEDIP